MELPSDTSRTSYVNAFHMWLDHGVRPAADSVPASELRLVSGLPFGLWVIDGDSSAEGRIFAAVAGDPDELAARPDGTLVRLHSSCIFSEAGDSPALDAWLSAGIRDPHNGLRLLGQPSDECDCRMQRIAAQAAIAAEGGVYLDLAEQEGRGWGLEIKREIYRLQRERGMDTAQACKELGIPFDIRNYADAADFLLKTLGLRHVRHLGNNPDKKRQLEARGLQVTLKPHIFVTPKTIGYLRTKRDEAGHLLPPDGELAAMIGTATPLY